MIVVCVLLFFTVQSDTALGQARLELLSERAEEVIQGLLARAPLTIIDLDAIPIQNLTPDLLIGSDDPYADDEVYLGGSVSLDLYGDSLYIADRRQDVIVITHKDGTQFKRIVGVQGEGPGEFRSVRSVFWGTNHYFVSDSRAHGLFVFDVRHEYVEFIASEYRGWNAQDASENLLVTNAARSENFLVDLREPAPPFHVFGSVLPRVTAANDPASAYNFPILAANDRGQLVTGYTGIPLLFFYDTSQQLDQIVRFTGKELAGLNTGESGGFGSYRINSWYLGIGFSEEGRVAVSTNEALYILAKQHGEYYLESRIRLTDAAGSDEKFVPFDIEFDGEDVIYAVSMGDPRVLRFRLDR